MSHSTSSGLRCLVSCVVLILSACGGGDGGTVAPPVALPTFSASSGVAQKGPLIQGATVTAQELDASLSPTGKQYSYQILSNLGSFSPTSTFGSQYIGLNATGYYFDEVANAVSSGTVTLNGYSDLTADPVLNVNILTTLAYQRIQHLMASSNLTFAAARAQAEGEVLAALNLPTGSYGNFGALDLSGGTDGDHILAAISSVFVNGNSSGPLSQLIANFQSDFGVNGKITSVTTKTALANSGKSLNPAAVAANLTQAYASIGVTFKEADIANWVDQDGDGVIGKFKFQVTSATPTSVFTIPSNVVGSLAGASVSASAGVLSINGAIVTVPTTLRAGDIVAVSPGAGKFPSGVLTIYLMNGAAKAARVSFISQLLSITLTPSSSSVAKGLTQQFTATGTFSDTSTADLTNNVAWVSGTPTVATIAANTGLAQTLATGTSTITATLGSVSATTALNVTLAVLGSIAVTPSPAFAFVGTTTQLTATGMYSDGSVADLTTNARWTSNSGSVATVVPTTGVATGVSLGSTTMQATVGSVSGSAPFSVTQLVQFTNAGATLVLDTRLGVTWTADAKLLASQYGDVSTIIALANAPGSELASAGVNAASFRSDGTMKWTGALAWVNYLNKIGYGGYNNWTLPTGAINNVAADPRCGRQFDIGCGPSTSGTGNQLSYIFINELDNAPGSQAANAGPFLNLLTANLLWSSNGCWNNCLGNANWFYPSVDVLSASSIDLTYGYAIAVRSN